MIGKSNIVIGDKTISRLAFGTHQFKMGSQKKLYGSLLDRYTEAGGNLIDTARVYAGGESEQVVGEWLASSGKRQEVLLCTKGGQPDLLPDANGNIVPHHRISANDIEADLTASLKALKTDTIDLYMLHKDDPSVSPMEVIEILNRFVKDGVVRHIGVSNWPTERIRKGNEYAKQKGLCGFVCSELAFSLKDNSTAGWGETELALEMNAGDYRWYQKSQLPVIGYNSQAYGFFYKENAADSATELNKEILKRFQAICRQKGLTPQQALFGCYFGCDLACIPLVTTNSLEHLDEILNNCNVTLDKQEVETLFCGRFD